MADKDYRHQESFDYFEFDATFRARYSEREQKILKDIDRVRIDHRTVLNMSNFYNYSILSVSPFSFQKSFKTVSIET